VTEADADTIAQQISGLVAVAPALRGATQVVAGNRNQATTVRGAARILRPLRWAEVEPSTVVHFNDQTDSLLPRTEFFRF
jgi:hypothetical protein